MNKDKVKVKVIRCIQIGDRRYVNAKLAAEHYASSASYRLFDKYREQWALRNGGDRYGLVFVLEEKLYRRTLPIFERLLNEAG